MYTRNPNMSALKTVKNQMKWHVKVYTVYQSTKKCPFSNYNLVPLYIYNGPSQVVLFNQSRRKNPLVYKEVIPASAHCGTTNGLPAICHFNGVSLAGQAVCAPLGCGSIFINALLTLLILLLQIPRMTLNLTLLPLLQHVLTSSIVYIECQFHHNKSR